MIIMSDNKNKLSNIYNENNNEIIKTMTTKFKKENIAIVILNIDFRQTDRKKDCRGDLPTQACLELPGVLPMMNMSV